MSRTLRYAGITVDRPDERHVAEEQRIGPSVALLIVSDDLKTKPVHVLRLTEDQALSLIDRASTAVVALRARG